MRPIDADALIDKYGDWYTEEGTEEGYIGTIKGIVDSMPTIEPEREKGRWICVSMDDYKCSKCGEIVLRHKYRFCPNCGKEMKGEEDA